MKYQKIINEGGEQLSSGEPSAILQWNTPKESLDIAATAADIGA